LLCMLSLSGCGEAASGGTAKIVEAHGKITLQGAPLAGANVTFVPEKGPIALGVTDADGDFTLSTGATQGVAVGNCKVGISLAAASAGPTNALPSAPDANADPAARKAFQEANMKAMRDRMEKKVVDDKPKSLIPEKYTQASTSGLTAVVTEDASKNN